jgi:hypothetical protein
LKLTVKYTKMNVQYCKLQRTSTGVFPSTSRGNGLRVLVAPLRHVGVLFLRPIYFHLLSNSLSQNTSKFDSL